MESTTTQEEGVQPFSYRLGKADSFKHAVAVVESLIEESHLVFSEDGVSLREMDPARICLVKLRIEEDQFEAVESSGRNAVGVGFEKLNKMLRLIDKGEPLEFRHSGGDRLELRTVTKTITVPTLDFPLGDVGPVSELPWVAHATVYARDFTAAVKRAEKLQDNVHVRIADGNVEIHAEDDYSGTYTEKVVDPLSVEGEGKAIYIAQYLLNAVKGIPKDTPVYIDLGDDLPIRVRYTIVDPAVQIEVWIAPRVED